MEFESSLPSDVIDRPVDTGHADPQGRGPLLRRGQVGDQHLLGLPGRVGADLVSGKGQGRQMSVDTDLDALNWDDVTGGRTPGREARLRHVLENGLTIWDWGSCSTYPVDRGRLRLEECADERTGARYGDAKCRRNRAVKLGGGGRNKGSRYAYQVWAVWN